MVKGFHITAPTCHDGLWASKCCLKACVHYPIPSSNTNTACCGLRSWFLAVCLISSRKCCSPNIKTVASTKELNCTSLFFSHPSLGVNFLKLSESHGSIILKGTTPVTPLVCLFFHQASERLQATSTWGNSKKKRNNIHTHKKKLESI